MRSVENLTGGKWNYPRQFDIEPGWQLRPSDARQEIDPTGPPLPGELKTMQMASWIPCRCEHAFNDLLLSHFHSPTPYVSLSCPQAWMASLWVQPCPVFLFPAPVMYFPTTLESPDSGRVSRSRTWISTPRTCSCRRTCLDCLTTQPLQCPAGAFGGCGVVFVEKSLITQEKVLLQSKLEGDLNLG